MNIRIVFIFFNRALSPRKNNFIEFNFINPIIVEQYRIKSGNWNHPLDIIYNATLTIRPIFNLAPQLKDKYVKDELGNYVVNEFQINEGKVEGTLKQFGAITQIRINFKANLENWILISEIMIRPKLN